MSSTLVCESDQFIAYPEAPNSRANRVIFGANEAVQSEGQSHRIRIPHNRLTYIDTTQSWLTFEATTTFKGAGLLACDLRMTPLGAESFIQNVRVFVNNRLINEFNDYSKICAMLQASNVGVGNNFGNSLTAGSGQDPSFENRGQKLDPLPPAAATSYPITRQYSFPLIGLMGCGNPKMIPVGELTSDIEIQITWGNSWDVFYQDSTPSSAKHLDSISTAFSKVAYSAHVITVAESVNTEIQKRSRDEDGIMSWSGQLWSLDARNILTIKQMQSGTSVNNILSGFRYKSLKNISVSGFNSNNTNPAWVEAAADDTRASAPTNQYGFWGARDQVRYNIAGRHYPQTYLSADSELAGKTNETFGNHFNGNTNNTFCSKGFHFNQRIIGIPLDVSATNVNVNMTAPQSLCIVPLEDSEIVGNAGIDTTAVQVVAQHTVDATGDGVSTEYPYDSLKDLLMCYCANYDVLYSINKDGIMSVSY